MTEKERIAQFLTDEWNSPLGRAQFMVDAPVMLTICRDGKFRKGSFIGEEMLAPIGAYVGKKGGLILKMRQEGATGEHVELTLNEASSHLEGFSTYYAGMMGRIEDIQVAEAREIGAAKEATADMEARHAANPLFGSW